MKIACDGNVYGLHASCVVNKRTGTSAVGQNKRLQPYRKSPIVDYLIHNIYYRTYYDATLTYPRNSLWFLKLPTFLLFFGILRLEENLATAQEAARNTLRLR